MKFEWDENKSIINQKKHKLSFYKAIGAFYDDCRIEIYDIVHSFYEDRYKTIGKIPDSGQIVYVSYCIRNETIRIISARYANKRERREYYDSNIRK